MHGTRVFAIVALATAAVAFTPSAALAAESAVSLEVTARVDVPAESLRTGDEVRVAITVENTDGTTQRVRLDELVSGVLDDTRLLAPARSSSPALVVTRLGHDRLALSGRLAPGASATVSYRVAVAAPSDRGDGVLSRAVVRADADAPSCGATPSASATGLDACTVTVLPGVGIALSSNEASTTIVTIGDGPAATGTIGASDLSSAAEIVATTVPVPLLFAAAGAIGAAVVVILALLRRRGASTRKRRNRPGTRLDRPVVVPVPARRGVSAAPTVTAIGHQAVTTTHLVSSRPRPTTTVPTVDATPARAIATNPAPSSTARHAAGSATPPPYASRRERRLAEAGRGLVVA